MKKFFTLIAAVMMAVGAMAGNHAVKLTHAAAKANAWDTQLYLKINNLEPNKVYKVYFDVKASENCQISTEEINDLQTEHKDPYGNSAVFNYTEGIDVTTEWTTAVATFKGVTTVTCSTEGHDAKHEGFEFAATSILLGVGKVPGEIYFDNLVVRDADNNIVYSNDFENGARVAAYDSSADAYYPGWQLGDGKGTWELDESFDHVVEDYMVMVELPEVKEQPWDSQLLVPIPTALQAGKYYHIMFSVKGSVESKECSSCVLQDTKSTNRDQWGGTADVSYSNAFDITTEWKQVSPFATQIDGKWQAVSNSKFPYDRLVIQLGKYAGTVYFDNFKFVEYESGSVISLDFKEGISGLVQAGQSHVSVSKAESDCPSFDTPTAIKTVNTDVEDNVMYNIAGQRVQNAKGIVIKNGKKFVF